MAPALGEEMAIVGDVVSLNVTDRVVTAVLPAESRAVTVRRLAPGCTVIPEAVQLVVPAAVPLPPRLFDHVTSLIPLPPDAVPPSVSDETPSRAPRPAASSPSAFHRKVIRSRSNAASRCSSSVPANGGSQGGKS